MAYQGNDIANALCKQHHVLHHPNTLVSSLRRSNTSTQQIVPESEPYTPRTSNASQAPPRRSGIGSLFKSAFRLSSSQAPRSAALFAHTITCSNFKIFIACKCLANDMQVLRSRSCCTLNHSTALANCFQSAGWPIEHNKHPANLCWMAMSLM